MCCPCLPTSWTRVKDWLHLVLVIGVLASVVCVIMQIVEIAFADSCHSPFCSNQLLSAIIVLPSLYDFFKFVGDYDESLQEHKQRAEDEVHGLIENINQQVAEMQDVAAKLTESATDFAFRTFDGSREGFEKFILDLNLYYGGIYQDPQMLEELRRFMVKWLSVFSQSLLDPLTNPLLQGVEEELRKCKNVAELCDKVTARLSKLKVSTRLQLVPAESYVIPTPREGGVRSLEDLRSNPSSASVTPSVTPSVHTLPSSVTSSFAHMEEGGTSASQQGGKCGVSWLRIGCNRKFGRQVSRTIDRDYRREWPLTISFCCGSITLLSRRHVNHLVYLLLDSGLIIYEGIFGQVVTCVLISANLMCVVSTLACFEQIDEIAQLQRRIHGYRQRSERVKEQHRKANENWAKVQQLHDLWNYRTQPFLIIMGKIHRALDNQDREYARALELARRNAGAVTNITPEQRLDWMKLTNESLECLDRKLGDVKDWTREGQAPLDKEWKETIGRQLRDAERQEDIDKLVQVLPLLTSDLRSLGDLPSSSRSPSPPASSR